MPRSDRHVAPANESVSAVRGSRTTRLVQRFHTIVKAAAAASGTVIMAVVRLVIGAKVGARTNATTAMSITAAGRISRHATSGSITRSSDAPGSWNRMIASTMASAIKAISMPLVPTTPNRNHAEGVKAASNQAPRPIAMHRAIAYPSTPAHSSTLAIR
jgi:hypothetical protein